MKDRFAEAVSEFADWLWREYGGVVTGVQRGGADEVEEADQITLDTAEKQRQNPA